MCGLKLVTTLFKPGAQLGQLRRQRFGLLLQSFQPKSAAVFDDELETSGLAEARDQALPPALTVTLAIRNLPIPFCLELVDDRLGAAIEALPFLEGLQDAYIDA